MCVCVCVFVCDVSCLCSKFVKGTQLVFAHNTYVMTIKPFDFLIHACVCTHCSGQISKENNPVGFGEYQQ